MNSSRGFSGTIALCVVLVAACSGGLPSPQATPTGSVSPSPAPTATVSPSPPATATPAPTPSATVTVVPTLAPPEEPYASPYPEGLLTRYPFADAVQVATGDGIACARLESGQVACWGYTDPEAGGLGDGVHIESEVPVRVSGIDDAVDIDVGYHHACVVRASGRVSCWGGNGNGRIGDGTVVTRPVPVDVSGIGNAVQVAAGESDSCARTEDGSVWCWGDPIFADEPYGLIPVRIDGVDSALDLDAAAHACVAVESGEVICWGFNGEGGVDPTSAEELFAPPTHVDGVGGAVTVSAGYDGTCALNGEGAITCWGPFGGPIPIAGAAASVVSVGIYACAVLDDQSVRCWSGTSSGRKVGVTDAVDVSVGNGTINCVVLGDGAVVCWTEPRVA